MRALALCVLFACDKPAPPPPPEVPARTLKLRYAAKSTDIGNFYIHEDARLFAIAVGPAGKATLDKIYPYPPTGCPTSGETGMQCALERANGGDHAMAGVTFEGFEAMVATLGPGVRVFFRHGGTTTIVSGMQHLAVVDGDLFALTTLPAVTLTPTPNLDDEVSALAPTGTLVLVQVSISGG